MVPYSTRRFGLWYYLVPCQALFMVDTRSRTKPSGSSSESSPVRQRILDAAFAAFVERSRIKCTGHRRDALGVGRLSRRRLCDRNSASFGVAKAGKQALKRV